MKTSDGRNGTNREIPFWNQQQRGLQATVQSNPTLFKSSQNSIKVVDPSKLSPDPTIPRGSEKAEFGNVCKGLRECAEEVNDDQNATTTRLSYPICKEEQMGFVS